MTNKSLIEYFYTSFSKGDHIGMSNCYHDDVVFEDPAFGVLEGEKVSKMWEMLISRSQDNLRITFDNVKTDHTTGSATWRAEYPFGPQKRPVINEISASFEFQDGKILKHIDVFNMWKWSRQALGLPGLLLGWTPLIKNKIQKQANAGLDAFMNQ